MGPITKHLEPQRGQIKKVTTILAITVMWAACLVVPFFYAGFGFFNALVGFFFTAFLAARVFRLRQTILFLFGALGAGVLTVFVDWYRETVMQGWAVRPELSPWVAFWITSGIGVLSLLYLIVKFHADSMRVKLLVSFVVTGAFSVSVLAWVTVINLEEILFKSPQAISNLSQNQLLGSPESMVRNVELLALALIGFLLLASIPLSNMMTAQVRRLTAVTDAVTSGDLGARAQVETEDEFGVLAGAINQMTSELQQNLIGLEQRVSDRTHELEKRSLQLQAVAEIGRVAATMRNPEELLSMVTRLISDRFNFYHVGIFLLEEESGNVDDYNGVVHHYAVLRAANSEGGQRMLARGHKLLVGQQGIVGFVTGTGNPRIALDVGEDPQYFNNPDLPLTRSEMALALSVAGNIIGALDVQSTQAGAFAREDVAILQIMADLVAIAIENARLFTQSEEALETSRRAFGELSRKAWIDILASKSDMGYTSLDYPYLPDNSGQVGNDDNVSEGEKTGTYPLSLPIKVRDMVIGYLDTFKPGESGGWTPEEYDMVTTIIDQLGVALESARLYEASLSQAERERLIGEVSSRMRESLDVDAVLRTSVQELRRSLGISQVEIRLALAVDNSSLLGRSQQALKEDQGAYGELTRKAWDELVRNRPGWGYRSEEQGLFRVEGEWYPWMVQAAQKGQLVVCQEGGYSIVSIPIRVRETILGVLDFRKSDETAVWTTEELALVQTLTDQFGQALESARLYQTTQLRAERERILADITSKVRASTNVNVILQTAVKELAEALRIPKGAIQLRNAAGDIQERQIHPNGGGQANG